MFFFRLAQMDSAKKTSRFGLDVSTNRVKTSSVILYIFTLVIDCIGFGW